MAGDQPNLGNLSLGLGFWVIQECIKLFIKTTITTCIPFKAKPFSPHIYNRMTIV